MIFTEHKNIKIIRILRDPKSHQNLENEKNPSGFFEID